MKLYLLSRTDDIDYDQYDAILVRAKNEEEARKLAAEHAGGTPWDGWTPENIKCEIVSNKGVAEVIIGSYNAG